MIPLPKSFSFDMPHACSRQKAVALRRQLLGFGSNVRRPLRFVPPFVTFCPVIHLDLDRLKESALPHKQSLRKLVKRSMITPLCIIKVSSPVNQASARGDLASGECGLLWRMCWVGLRLPHMKKRDKSLAILYSLGDAINIVHQTNTGRARKQELGDRSFKG